MLRGGEGGRSEMAKEKEDEGGDGGGREVEKEKDKSFR